MTCVICKYGTTRLATATVTLERGGSTLVFKDVPAQVCENCGEEYVSENIIASVLAQAEQAIDQGIEMDIRHFRAA
jgi:YgiT-type zinc finger domain-containing protein